MQRATRIAVGGSGAAGWNSLAWVNGDFFYKEISLMWLASLRRLIHGKTRSPKTKKPRQQRRRIVPALEHLENRIVPTGPNSYSVVAGDTAGLITAINNANSDTTSGITGDIITLTKSTYSFASANNTTNGANVLPVITATNLTITGAGSTLDAGGKGRLFDVASVASVTLVDMTLANGLASGAMAQGGAVYSSGSLTLKNDIIGRKEVQTRTVSYNSTGRATHSGVTTKVVGGTNRATGGTGGNGQGAGIYVAGGSLNVTSCTLASNKATGGSSGNGQGGGIYANGSTLTLKNDLIGQKVTRFKNTNGATTKTVYTGGPNLASGGVGGVGQGGGLYVSGGTVNVTDDGILANRAVGAAGTANIAGGNAQGGGLFANATTLNVTGGAVSANGATGGSGGAGTVNHFAGSAGGNAQGGGIYANATTLTVSGAAINDNGLFNGQGGNGATGTANHPSGGAGGASGLVQGGGIYSQGGSLTLTNAASVNNNSGGANVSGGQGGAGDNGAGGAGGAGSNGDGGGVFASGASIFVESGATVNDNTVSGAGGGYGGNGGVSKAGGAGGNAGYGLGGGMFVQGGTVSITGAASQINLNTAIGGPGGYAGAGGAAAGGASGGTGGESDGGGLYALNAPVTFTGSTTLIALPQRGDRTVPPGINGNTIEGGRGGNGGADTKGPGATGAAGGAAQGGGLFVSGTGQSVTLGSVTTLADIIGNTAGAGAGGSGGISLSNSAAGAGGAGGKAFGGGAAIIGDTLTENNTTYEDNSFLAGSGGTGGSVGKTVGKHGNGGAALGGGLYVSGSSGVSILNSLFFANDGTGGGGGIYLASASQYGTGGNAEGGGLYADASTVNVLNSTFDVNLLSGGVAGSSNTKYGGATEGGGLFAAGGTLSLTNDTVAWNELSIAPYQGSPAASGGGLATAGSALNLTNTIIALDQIYTNPGPPATSSTLSYDDFDGTAAVNGHNLIGSSTTDPNYAVGGSQQLFVGSLSFPAGTFYSGQFPTNNGGLTYTLPLLWGNNPAIDTGDPSAASTIASAEGVASSNATDARGSARVVNGTIDSGAYETQVVLAGSAAPPIVQLNGNITYTLEVCNCESTAANVTLTDALDPNTSYQSGSGTGWTVTAPTVSNPNTVTATASLAAHTMATLTITVSVPSSVPNGTTSFTNTASITPTGSSASQQRSTTMKTPLGSSVATTTTSLTASANPTVYGQPVVFTATVTASSGTPGGTVTFEDGSTVLGTGTLNSNGVTTFSTSALSVGSGHSITAIYGGDSNDSGSTSSALSHTVNQDGATTTVTSSAHPSVFGQSVTFTATVSANLPGSGTPTGTVTFKDGSTTLGTVTLNSNGVATFSTTTLTVGNHSITVVYGGDSNFQASTSSALSQEVIQVTANITNPTIAAFGQVSATLKASSSSLTDASAGFTYTINWGDGTAVQTVVATANNGTGVPAPSHSYANAGIYTISVTAADQAGITSQSATAIVVFSKQASDGITVSGGTSAGQVAITTTDEGNLTTTSTPQQVLVAGSGGTDTYTVNFGSTLTTPITITGGGSNSGDTLVVNGDSSSTNVINKSTGQITWGNPVTETVYRSSIPNTTINANGTSTNYITDPGDGTTINGGPGTNNITITSTAASGVVINGGPHANNYTVDLGNLAGTVTIHNSNTATTTTNNLIVNGATGNNTINVAGNQITEGAQTITDTASLASLMVNGGSGTNQMTVSALTVPVTNVTLAGSSGTNTYTINAGSTVNIVAGTGVNILNVNGGNVVSINAPSGVTAPIVFAANYAMLDNGTLNEAASTGVLVNDRYTNGQSLTAVLGTGPAHGSLTLNADGSFVYTPAANFVGTDTFTYQAKGSDGSLSALATVTIQVSYKFGGFLPPLSNGISFALNRTIPIKFTLSDVNGNAITSLSAVTAVQIQALNSSGNPSGAPFTPASTNNQGLQFTGGHYQYNWQTKGLTAGSYVIEVVLADGTTQTDTIQLVAHGNSAGLMSGSGGTATAGALMGGEVDLYVDNSDGELTSDELSRITDAVNSIDTTIAPYGVTIVQVTDPTLANVTLSMNTTSAVGGYAQGVLGCTTDADQVTMIQGWNWYAGSDATQIGSTQYDFETAVIHELGHALGLGHSSSSTSVMYASLTTGAANRALVAADLNVPDTDSGPCALHAAPVMSVSGASNVQGMAALNSTSVASNGSPMSGLDQLFANLALILADARNAFQSEMASLAALWQQADALVLQRLDFVQNLMQVSRLPNED